MTASLSSYQSAMQLVAGANLAIFALPKLGMDEFRIESKRWKIVVRQLKKRGDISLAAMQGFSEFKSDRLEVESRNARARRGALLMAVLASGTLVYMSEYPEQDIGAVTVLILLLGLVPAAALWASHCNGRLCLAASRVKRLAIS